MPSLSGTLNRSSSSVNDTEIYDLVAGRLPGYRARIRVKKRVHRVPLGRAKALS